MVEVLVIGIAFIIFSLLVLSLRAITQNKVYLQQLSEQSALLSSLSLKEQQLRQESQQLKHQLQEAYEDPMTHTLSRRVFEDRIQQAIKECERYHMGLGLAIIDIDEFKNVNEVLGFEVGDRLLIEVAKRIESCIRQVDSLARYNKDAFVILLAQLPKAESASIVMQRILQALKAPFYIDNQELLITVGIGISIYPDDSISASGLLRNAETALTIAKKKGRHAYQFFKEELHVNSERKLSLQISLNRESIFNEFIIYYQPVINIENEDIFCIDAQLCWPHPKFGLINQEELIQCAAKIRKQPLIFEWLLRNACDQFLRWQDMGFSSQLLGVSLSLPQLLNLHFIYRMTQIFQELRFSPKSLLVSITDFKIHQDNVALVIKAFNMLKYIGVKLAIANFGAEQIALNDLKKISVEYVKLSKDLIEDIHINPPTSKMVKAVVDLARSFQIEVILTGLTTAEQKQKVKALDIHLVQGQLFGLPLNAKEMEDQKDKFFSSIVH